MRYIIDLEEIMQKTMYMAEAAMYAKKSTCKKSQRGVVIVKYGRIIGAGFNKPTLDSLCNPCIREDIKNNGQVELCSASHAEWEAILDASKKGNSLIDSTMYHIKVKDGVMKESGNPSCTVCSRLIYQSGIKEMVLWHKEGLCVYGSKEFNKLSFDYFLKENKNNLQKNDFLESRFKKIK